MKYVLAAAALATVASAQQTVWGQCGGNNWNGPKSCVAGSTCTVLNEWYYQCVPGGPTAQPTTTRTTTTVPASTTRPASSSVRSSSAVVPPSSTRPASSSTRITTTTTTRPSSVVVPPSSTTQGPPPASGNPWAGYQLYANPYYSSEVYSLAIPSLLAKGSTALAAKASAVAKVNSFVWLDTIAKVPTLDTYAADIRAQNQAGANPPIAGTFTIYDLPDRDCAALASNGELAIAADGVNRYKHEYIDAIVTIVKKYPDVKFFFVVEPDSLANMVTNLNVAKCANAAKAYNDCTIYAVQQLNLPNVVMYLDAGHAGWLGYPANLQGAADVFGKLYVDAGKPAALRGLATNVSNYNAFSIATCPAYTAGATNCDEKRYINALAPLLQAKGFPAHFITDQSRSGKQPTGQAAWGDWCNAIGTGFGARPTTNTGDALADAFVWIKPGGECDGTSNTSAVRYDSHCGQSAALKPAPEAGQWFQAYFEQLLTNANPPF